MVVCLIKLVPLIKQRRIEDKVHILLDEPFHVAMRQLGRIALGFARDRLDAHLVNLSV